MQFLIINLRRAWVTGQFVNQCFILPTKCLISVCWRDIYCNNDHGRFGHFGKYSFHHRILQVSWNYSTFVYFYPFLGQRLKVVFKKFWLHWISVTGKNQLPCCSCRPILTPIEKNVVTWQPPTPLNTRPMGIHLQFLNSYNFSLHIVFAILDGIRNSCDIQYPDFLLHSFPVFQYPLYR